MVIGKNNQLMIISFARLSTLCQYSIALLNPVITIGLKLNFQFLADYLQICHYKTFI